MRTFPPEPGLSARCLHLLSRGVTWAVTLVIPIRVTSVSWCSWDMGLQCEGRKALPGRAVSSCCSAVLSRPWATRVPEDRFVYSNITPLLTFESQPGSSRMKGTFLETPAKKLGKFISLFALTSASPGVCFRRLKWLTPCPRGVFRAPLVLPSLLLGFLSPDNQLVPL